MQYDSVQSMSWSLALSLIEDPSMVDACALHCTGLTRTVDLVWV